MTYRDDLDAARLRRESLSRELADVRARLGDRDALLEQERALAAALEDTQAHIDHARKRVELPLLRDVRVASPCKESWDDMKGDERTRFCGRCEKNVYDLSEITAVEAEALLAAHGTSACVRFYRRADGTVMTSDCPEGIRRRRRRNLVLAAALAVGSATGAGVLAFSGDDEPKEQAYAGGPVFVPPEDQYTGAMGATGYPSALAIDGGMPIDAYGLEPGEEPNAMMGSRAPARRD